MKGLATTHTNSTYSLTPQGKKTKTDTRNKIWQDKLSTIHKMDHIL